MGQIPRSAERIRILVFSILELIKYILLNIENIERVLTEY